MFPLGMVVFPHQVVGLCVFESRYQQMLADIESEPVFGTCLIARGSEVGGADQRTSVATVVHVIASQRLDDDKTLMMVEGTQRVEISEWLDDAPYPRARVDDAPLEGDAVDPQLLRSTESAVRALRAIQSEMVADQCLKSNCEMDEDPLVRTWQLCSMAPMPVFDQFAVLSLPRTNERLRLIAEICCERYGDYQRILALG
ncbi:MAG TPA: LON peptidase substrate-binding domain-containing protein [Acidimicrobiales bacterium]|nr:LON peptidase substrate-binding domain-containing protein [Acidimicrobiales bacterium]